EANDAITANDAKIPTHNIANKKNYIYEGDDYRHVIDVDFDVAITATETEGNEGGGGLKVAGLLSFGGNSENRVENQTISRVKYTIPLVLDITND
ncbi:MAG: hypothetical protein IIU87_04830, partial [Prevotella sp.]|nr:hypothetical protein [Prevotella sp.]